MAAGLTLHTAGYAQFRQAFNEEVKAALGGRYSVRQYLTDGPLTDAERSLDNALMLASGMPWGQGFEAPVFNNTFCIVSQREVGKGHLKLVLQAQDSKDRVNAIAFNQEPVAQPDQEIDVVYSLDANDYRDSCSLQLRVHYMKLALR